MKRFLMLLVFLIFGVNNLSVQAQDLTSTKAPEYKVYKEGENFGLKDSANNIIIKAKYKKLIRIGDNAWICQCKNKFGLIDNTGKILIKPKYTHTDRYFGKYIKLGNENDYGLYDEFGNVLIKPEYTSIEPLFGKMFLTRKNYKFGVISESGQVLLDNKFDDIYMPNSKIMRIQYNGKWLEIKRLSGEEFILSN